VAQAAERSALRGRPAGVRRASPGACHARLGVVIGARKLLTAMTLCCCCLTPAARAAAPPTAPGGQVVTQVAAGLNRPTAFAFGGGLMFAADGGSEDGKTPGGVFVIQGGTATRLPGSPAYAAGLAWRNGTLYVSASTKLLAWSGWNGTAFARRRTIFNGPNRFSGFNGLGFGADGRLYAGVAVAETGAVTDDHGPTGLPYAREILSLTPAGRDLQVFARGIRQPWQMAFPAGSSSPYVSDLGQDSGADEKLVHDFVLRVRAGQNYGFPSCNWVSLKACAGSARPFKFFAPHTDAMGLGILGTRLYISEFGATQKGGQVVSMPTTGGPVTTLLTGFAAPIVGLATHAGAVYVGEFTGQVFSVRP
jgi:glucose/arabinose dehydrogenase